MRFLSFLFFQELERLLDYCYKKVGAQRISYITRKGGQMNKPVLKVEIRTLGFAGGAPKGEREYVDLQKKLAELLKEQMDSRESLLAGGLQVKSIVISLCEQLDDLHWVEKEKTLIRAERD